MGEGKPPLTSASDPRRVVFQRTLLLPGQEQKPKRCYLRFFLISSPFLCPFLIVKATASQDQSRLLSLSLSLSLSVCSSAGLLEV